MAQKNIKIGKKNFKYNLPRNSDINKYIIKLYNETSKQRSYYFVTMMEEWCLVADDDDCVIMTIYCTTVNGEVLNKEFYTKQNSGEIQKLSSRPFQSKRSLDTIQCEVKEMVDSPNVSYPVFILNAAQESNTHYYVQILKHGNTKFIKLSTSENNEIIDTTIELQSRRSYECKLYKVNKIDEECVVTGVTEVTWRIFNLKTRNCQRDVEKLKEKATSYVNGRGEYKVIYLYRNKPSYHQTIIESKSTGILKKYLKDNNGDEYSSINTNISGLHLSATPGNSLGDLPGNSYFGDYRIMVFPEYLVEGCNLYFADFYCMRSSIHWVTLVLTKRGSDEDMFCQDRLVKLNIENNSFFYKSWDGYRVTPVQVEILYTEDINLTEMRSKTGFEERVTSTCGNGSSKPNGVPKNGSCSICNLHSI